MNNHAPFSTLALSYADWRDYQIHAVNMSYRDLQMIVDVLHEYSGLLQEHMRENPPKNFWAKHNKEELVRKTMEVSDRLADAIGLDKTYPKCQKWLEKQGENRDDVGGEALTLALTHRKGA